MSSTATLCTQRSAHRQAGRQDIVVWGCAPSDSKNVTLAMYLRQEDGTIEYLCTQHLTYTSLIDEQVGSGQQDQEQGQGQAVKEVIAERRQVIKAALRGLVEAARPDLSPAEVDTVVAEVNKRMTMGSKQCCLTAVLCLAVLLQSFLGESRQRPIELCSWTDLEALPPIGKGYQQRYKLVNDRLPKGRQWLHRAAECRRGIDGRARNNA
ncbi:hypothetical protein QJQ45_029283 [Haematococcus lacustris]|nr:hypothetical protein QJQ45_029283 [Haematococcus lacustris]